MSKIVELGAVSDTTNGSPAGTILEGTTYGSCNDGSGRLVQTKFDLGSGRVGTCDDPLDGEGVQ